MIAPPGSGAYTVRRHVRDDVEAVVDLIAAVERSVLGVVHIQRADIASLWNTDTFTPELDDVAVLEASRMVAAAQLYRRKAEVHVHPTSWQELFPPELSLREVQLRMESRTVCRA